MILGHRGGEEGVTGKGDEPCAVAIQPIEQCRDAALRRVEARLAFDVFREHRTREIEREDEVHGRALDLDGLQAEQRASDRDEERGDTRGEENHFLPALSEID